MIILNQILNIIVKKALFFVIVISQVVFVSCKKKTNTLGLNSIDGNEILNGTVVDTFSLTTYTEIADSIITSTISTGLLGSYNDPEFGTVHASIFTQLRLSSTSPNFGDVNTITIDSLVLGLKYEGSYGTLNDQTFEVYELSDTMDLGTYYYSFSDKSITNQNLIVPSKATLTPNPISDIYIDTVAKSAQLRLHLDTNLAKVFINEAANNSATYASNETFSNFFKGLKINVNNGAQSEGDGAILYFALNDPDSKLTIYYKQAGVKKTFDFLINSSSAKFNQVLVDNSGHSIENVINNIGLGQTTFYAQALKSRAVIEIPGLLDLPKNTIVHQAILSLPVQTNLNYDIGSEVSVATKLEKSTSLYNIGSGVFNETEGVFELDLKSYVQSILTDERYPVTIDGTNLDLLIEGTKIYVYPKFFNSSANRIIFNGSSTLNTQKPKLIIKYTEF